MQNNDFIVQSAKAEQQGSFCDVVSENHYNVVQPEEVDEATEAAMRRGDSASDFRASPSDTGVTALFTEDSGGVAYQSTHGPRTN